MDTAHCTIKTTTAFVLLGEDPEGRTLPVQLTYDTRTPLAVYLMFDVTGSRPTEWVCARSLLRDGLRAPSGEGDLRIEPIGPDGALIELSSPDGQAHLLAPSADLSAFLADSFDMVNESDELRWLDIDAAIEDILADHDIND